MKNFIYISLLFLTANVANAQLNVVGDNFVFSKGTDIFVKEEVNLVNPESRIFLRGEAQLIQESNVPNEGEGVLSIFQEGTSNEYTYNYWSAPVSDQTTGTNGNVGFKNIQLTYPTVDLSLMTPPTTTDFTITNGDAIILPFNMKNGISDDADVGGSQLQIAGRWLYTYDSGGNPATGYAGWSNFNSPTAIARSGYGFTMKGTREVTGGSLNYDGGQRYDFRGRPNNGTIQVGVGNDNGTLAGNPYPSALDLKRFIEENSFDSGAGTVLMDPWVEFWESQEETDHNLVSYLGGYARYVPLGFAPGSNDGYANDGTYLEPVFRRTNNDGTINTSSSTTSLSGPPTPPADNTSFVDNALMDGKRRYAAVGQGFFISRTNTDVPYRNNVAGFPDSYEQDATPNISAGVILPGGQTGELITFNNSMRVFQRENTTTSIFKAAPGVSDPQSAIVANQIPKMIINVIPENLYVRPLKFIFDDSTTQGYDYSWEGTLSGRIDTDAYIKIGTEGEFGLSSQPFDENMTIPIGVEVASSNTSPIDVEFELAFLINFSPNDVFLHDTQSGTYHDLKAGNKTLLIAPGHYTDRFEITFKDTSGTLSNDSVNEVNFDIFQNNNRRELTILNPNQEDVASIALFDLAGREVLSNKPASTQSSYTFDTASLSSAIYIAKVTTTDNKEKSVKVSISN
ncbi:putative secreted protein (Por secretion system target) [Nonlabens dokdonensis]|jgi:hypothetical protein|uniref:Secretion system C-terminal sorting domain-containing protein n=2 Tax=Nonlabens dokdonensis TaxID=328515 RepID=L7W5M3_NONDD|nr:T9SS type A sorting domain-containing protein [Nonlabens dokdonensis]AGC75492.1 hypothetical protein DDD_0365 [Nonlabens dokdonensis DSW-6]PZX43188.1 putative secreted protein (Por secretion system target) [Nonlabens dokdonensis]